MADESSLTHAAPVITELTFANALTETSGRVFSSAIEIGPIWRVLLQYGIDPAFALGQFWAESLFGSEGWNVWSKPPMLSWGNILYANTQLKDRPGVTSYAASNGFVYASYPDWTTGVEDYCLLLGQYAKTNDDPRYGDTATVYGATAKWSAKVPGSLQHLNYFDVVLGRMNRYDARAPYEGDMAIFSQDPSLSYSSNYRYAVKAGDRWFLKPGGTVSYEFRSDGSGYYLGTVDGTSWFAIRVQTARLSTDGKVRSVIGYLPSFDKARLTKVAA